MCAINSNKLSPSECMSVFMALMFVLIALMYVAEALSTPFSLAHDVFFLFDFQLRYNEVHCLFSGTDPFKVWNGEMVLSHSLPWRSGCQAQGWHEYVHAYPPWSYSFFMPIALLPKKVAALCWLFVEIVSAVALYTFAFFSDKRSSDQPLWRRIVPVIAALPILSPVCLCLNVSNYGLIIALSVLLMALLLDQDRQIVAGVFLALAMVKPQIGMLFVVPLLVGRKFRTLLCGGIICAFASLPPALLCGSSPIDMILSIKEYRAVDLLAGSFVSGAFLGLDSTIINAIVGIVSCAVLSWMFRNARNWVERFLPASILCVMWTVSRGHDYCIYIIPFAVLGKLVVDNSKRLDVVAASFCPYLYSIICRGIGLQLLLSTTTVFCFGVAVACTVLCVVWRRRLIRYMLSVTMLMAVLATSAEGLDMNIWTLVYLLMVACMSKIRDSLVLLTMAMIPFLLFYSGSVLPPQTAGWLIIVLMFVLGGRLNAECARGTLKSE